MRNEIVAWQSGKTQERFGLRVFLISFFILPVILRAFFAQLTNDVIKIAFGMLVRVSAGQQARMETPFSRHQAQ